MKVAHMWKSPFSKPRNVATKNTHDSHSLVTPEDSEKSGPPMDLFLCNLGSQIDSGFMRVCFATVEHAGESTSDMDNHFRTAVSAALEELLEHRRECPVCRGSVANNVLRFES